MLVAVKASALRWYIVKRMIHQALSQCLSLGATKGNLLVDDIANDSPYTPNNVLA